MTLSKTDKENFETLHRAFEAGDVALIELKRKSDGKVVAAIAAVGREEGGDYTIVPFAVMMEGDPYEDFLPPSTEGDGQGFCEPDARGMLR